MKLTYQELTLSIPIPNLIQIEDFYFYAELNQHARASVKILMKEAEIESSVHEVRDGDKITIWEKDEKILFKGKLSSVRLLREHALNYLYLEAVSHTYDWGLEEVSQSFCDLEAGYMDVAGKVLSNQPGASIKDCVTKGVKIPHFLLQYEESDWTFLKRLASHFGTFLVPDLTAEGGRVYFGLPGINSQAVIKKQEYSISKNMEQYYQFSGDKNFTAQETVKWQIITKRFFILGEEVLVNKVKAVITKIEYCVKDGILTRCYVAGRKKGVKRTYQKNPRIYGMSIPATVKERNGNCVRVHFDIDKSYEPKPGLQYFTYAIETSCMYCMPEVGSKVHIYFPSHYEQYAIAVHAVRLEGAVSQSGSTAGGGSGAGGYAQNPDHKSFSNVNGAELLMTPEAVSAAAEAEKETMLYLDNEGNIMVRGKNFFLNTDTDLIIGEGVEEPVKDIALMGRAGVKVNIAGSEGEGLTLSEEVNVMSTFLKMDASERTPVKPSPDEIAAQFSEQDKANRDAVNDQAKNQLVEKIEAGRSKIIGGIIKALTVVATVALVVATGGAGALLVPMLVTGGIALAFAAADIAEGVQDYNKGMSGDLSKSFNFIRDTVFGGNEFLYELAKAVNDIIFGVVTGKALSGNIASKLKAISFICNKGINTQTMAHIGVNVITGAIQDFVQDGKIDPATFAFNTVLGIFQGQVGSRISGALGKVLGSKVSSEIMKKVINFAADTGVDTLMDFAMSKIYGQDFNVWESLLKNSAANLAASYGGEPVEVASGAYIINAADLILPGLKGQMEFKRQYLSTVKKAGAMGRGWSFCYDSRIYQDKGSLHLDTVTGHNVLFRKEDAGWKPESKGCRRFKLEENKEGRGFLLSDRKEHTQYRYDMEGRLTCIRDQNKQETSFRYGAGGLEEIHTACGNRVEVICAEGRILQISDETGRTLQYRYDGDLLTDVVHMDNGITHYEYDDNGYLSSVTDQNGLTYLKSMYDPEGRVISQKLSNGDIYEMEYDDNRGEVQYYYSGLDRRVVYACNKDRLVTCIRYEDGSEEKYGYDEENFRIRETDRRGNVTEKVFHPCGMVLKEAYADGYVKEYAYNEELNCIREGDSGGRETVYAYDACHNRTEERRKLSEGRQQVLRRAYDEKGRITEEWDGKLRTALYRYGGSLGKPDSVENASGEETRHEHDAIGRRTAIENAYGRAEFGYNSRNFVTSRKDGEGNLSQYLYDKMGKLIAYYPPEQWKQKQQGWRFAYDDFDRKVLTVTPMEESWLIRRNGEGDILKEIHPNSLKPGEKDGIGTIYEYDKDSRRIRVRHPDGGTERFFYDPAGNRIKHVLPEAYDEERDDGAGYTYAFDGRNRLTEIHNPEGVLEKSYAYDYYGNITEERDGSGHHIFYQYNFIGKLTEKREEIRRDENESYYRITLYEYDSRGNLIYEKRGLEEARHKEYPAAYQTISFKYDPESRIILIKDNEGAEVRRRWDCLGNCTLEEYLIEEGITKRIRYRYDACGRLVRREEEIDGNEGCRMAVTKYAYDGNGKLNYMKSPNGYTAAYEYDGNGRLIKERLRDKKNGIDRSTAYSYDKAGNLISMEEGARGLQGIRTILKYDWKNRLTHRETPSGIKRHLYDQNDRLIKEILPEAYAQTGEEGAGSLYRYDSRGNLTESINALGNVSETRTYSAAGLLEELADGTGEALRLAYTPDGQLKSISSPHSRTEERAVQEYEYNSRGQITGITDGRRNKTIYETDAWGRILKLRTPDGSTESYSYSPAGNTAATTDANGNTITYRYNSLGKVRETEDPEGNKEYFSYDGEGNMVLYTDRNGNRTEYAYNADGNITLQTAEDKTGMYKETAVFQYNAMGLLKKASNSRFTYQYRYDAEGRLTEKKSGGKSLFRQEYDRNGQPVRLEDATGKSSIYEYDAAGHLINVKEDSGTVIASYEYDAGSRLKRIFHKNGLSTEYEYDSEGNMSHLTIKNRDEIYFDYRYAYDGNGNRIRKAGMHLKMDGTGLEEADILYEYDKKNQLTMESYGRESIKYGYDPAGNRTSMEAAGNVTEYRYNGRNQLASLQEKQGKRIFTYDPQGCMIKEEGSEGTIQYEYNPLNQLVKAVKPDRQIQINRYDPEGLRAEMEENEMLSRFAFRNGEVITEEESADKELSPETVSGRITRYIRGYGIECAEKDGIRYFHYKDEQLSTILITAENGSIKNRYRYDAFGTMKESREDVRNRFLYTGQQYDGVMEQYYLRARYFDPIIGRFTSEDVYRGDGLNLYAYCANNPVTYYDPSGYAGCPDKNQQGDQENSRRTADEKRNSPGTVTGSEGLKDIEKMMRGSEGNIGIIPKEIGDKLQGKTYNNFDDFRKDFWKEVSNSSYANEFSQANITRMSNGLAPKTMANQNYGQVSSYTLHHKDPIYNGGGVYDLSNLVIVTPRFHQEILDPNFHYNY